MPLTLVQEARFLPYSISTILPELSTGVGGPTQRCYRTCEIIHCLGFLTVRLWTYNITFGKVHLRRRHRCHSAVEGCLWRHNQIDQFFRTSQFFPTAHRVCRPERSSSVNQHLVGKYRSFSNQHLLHCPRAFVEFCVSSPSI
jgi:hypothetical protein